jgi:hypothetical protein
MVRAAWRHADNSSEIPCRVRQNLPTWGVIPELNPAHNGEAVSLNRPPFQGGVLSRPGNSVGSRSSDASIAGLDPVTTDRPSGREIAVPVEIAPQSADSANSWTRSDAGPLNSSGQYLSPYITGYADGEGCFTVSIAPREKILVRWEVRPSFSVSQNRDRAEVGGKRRYALEEILRTLEG